MEETLPSSCKVSPMLDLIYLAVAILFFALCWALAQACETL